MDGMKRREFIKAMAAALILPSSLIISKSGEKQLIEERYEAGDVWHLKSKFSEKQQAVLNNFHGFAESISLKLMPFGQLR